MGFRRALSSAYLILAAAYFLIGSIGASWLAPVRNLLPLGIFVAFVLENLHTDMRAGAKGSTSFVMHLAGCLLFGGFWGFFTWE